MDAILEFAEQCADADAAKIEQLMSMMFYDWTTEAKLGYIDREMCIKYNRVDNYWWLPPAFRLTDEWPMWQKHMVEMCRKNAFRCWEKFWRTQVADRKDAVAQIYWSNLMLPEVVRRDFSDYLRHVERHVPATQDVAASQKSGPAVLGYCARPTLSANRNVTRNVAIHGRSIYGRS